MCPLPASHITERAELSDAIKVMSGRVFLSLSQFLLREIVCLCDSLLIIACGKDEVILFDNIKFISDSVQL